jgi:acid phosphatase family membrane protein YuiD
MSGVGWTYAAAPLLAWVAAGSAKFLINSWKARTAAYDRIGLGGMPSTHTAIVITMLVLTGLREGIATAWFGIAATLALIVVIDAMDLRRKIGLQAAHLQRLFPEDEGCRRLRARTGHTPAEILGGIAVGSACAVFLQLIG